MIQAATAELLKARNPDGGWGAEQGRRSNTEATSLTLLALRALDDNLFESEIHQGLGWLVERQNADGSWPLRADSNEASWTTSVAVICLAALGTHRERALLGARWLLGQTGWVPGWFASLLTRLLGPSPVRLNPHLKGWPWAAGAFSWVEPTAYALIALKKLQPDLPGPQSKERIREGERMIYDRMCEGGGWNYGNSNVFGVNVAPYPETTALALIALQDHQAEEANRLSLQALRRMLGQGESGLMLAWAILCFSIYGQETFDWKQLLARSYEKARFLGVTRTLALAILASTDGRRFLHA